MTTTSFPLPPAVETINGFPSRGKIIMLTEQTKRREEKFLKRKREIGLLGVGFFVAKGRDETPFWLVSLLRLPSPFLLTKQVADSCGKTISREHFSRTEAIGTSLQKWSQNKSASWQHLATRFPTKKFGAKGEKKTTRAPM